jgi:hypothetical protein
VPQLPAATEDAAAAAAEEAEEKQSGMGKWKKQSAGG